MIGAYKCGNHLKYLSDDLSESRMAEQYDVDTVRLNFCLEVCYACTVRAFL